MQRPLVRRGETHAVGDDERHAIGRGQIRQRLVVGRLVAIEVPLQLDVDVVAAEDPDQPIEQPADAVLPRVQQLPARQRHQAFHAPVERLERERALSLRRVQLHRRDEPRQILIAGPRRDQDGEDELMVAGCGLRIAGWRSQSRRSLKGEGGLRVDGCELRVTHRNRQLGADDRLQARGGGGLVEARHAAETVAIDQRDGGVAQRGGAVDEGFRRGGALEKGEGRSHVELNVHVMFRFLFANDRTGLPAIQARKSGGERRRSRSGVVESGAAYFRVCDSPCCSPPSSTPTRRRRRARSAPSISIGPDRVAGVGRSRRTGP